MFQGLFSLYGVHFSSCHAKVKTEPASRVENSILMRMLGPLEDTGACSTDETLSPALALFSFSWMCSF